MPEARFLTEPTIEYVANSERTIKLDRGFNIRELALKLTCNVNVATGGTTTARGNIAAAGVWSLIRNIRLKLNSNNNIRDFSGDVLQMLNWFYYNQGDLDSLNIVGIAADGSAIVETTLLLPLWMVDSRKPIDTMLAAPLLSDLSLTVNWGNAANVGTATGFEISSATLEVSKLASYGLNGPFNTQVLNVIQESDVPVSTRFQVELPVGNLYRSFLIGQQNSAGDDDPDNIENIRLFSGGTDYFNIDFEAFQNWQRRRNRQQQSLDSTGALNSNFVSTNRDLNAWQYIDLVTDGLMSETLNTTGFSTLKLEFEVTGALDSLIIVPQEIIPLRGGNGNNGG